MPDAHVTDTVEATGAARPHYVILARKNLKSNTRIVRQTRLLLDRGYDVSVLSTFVPGDDLLETVQGAKFYETKFLPTFLHKLIVRVRSALVRFDAFQSQVWNRLQLGRVGRHRKNQVNKALGELAVETRTPRIEHLYDRWLDPVLRRQDRIRRKKLALRFNTDHHDRMRRWQSLVVEEFAIGRVEWVVRNLLINRRLAEKPVKTLKVSGRIAICWWVRGWSEIVRLYSVLPELGRKVVKGLGWYGLRPIAVLPFFLLFATTNGIRLSRYKPAANTPRTDMPIFAYPVYEMLRAFFSNFFPVATNAAFARSAMEHFGDTKVDFVHIHDTFALRAGSRLALKWDAKIVYDAVEMPDDRSGWTTNHFTKYVRWAETELWERKAIKASDLVFTVSPSLQTWIDDRFTPKQPTALLRNCRFYEEHDKVGQIRTDCGLGADNQLVLYLNSIYPSQGLENLIDALAQMPGHIHVATLGAIPVPAYGEELMERARERGVANRLHLLEPKLPTEMLEYAAGADLGVIPRQATNLCNLYSLPNRVFEYVMARVPFCVGGLTDIRALMLEHDIGEAFDETDAASIAATLERCLQPERLAELKANVTAAARELSWEREGLKFVDAVDALKLEASQFSGDSRQAAAIAAH